MKSVIFIHPGVLLAGRVNCVTSVSRTPDVFTGPVMTLHGLVTVISIGEEYSVTKVTYITSFCFTILNSYGTNIL